MTEEEKQLLLKELCCRLPYGVKVHAKWIYQEPYDDGEIIHNEKDCTLEINELYNVWNYNVWNIKPYLRPLSSMTEEEKDYSLHHGANLPYIGVKDMDEYITWLNAHHFDYHDLIDQGLALPAPEGMYEWSNIK